VIEAAIERLQSNSDGDGDHNTCDAEQRWCQRRQGKTLAEPVVFPDINSRKNQRNDARKVKRNNMRKSPVVIGVRRGLPIPMRRPSVLYNKKVIHDTSQKICQLLDPADMLGHIDRDNKRNDRHDETQYDFIVKIQYFDTDRRAEKSNDAKYISTDPLIAKADTIPDLGATIIKARDCEIEVFVTHDAILSTSSRCDM
jgi:hypothetical protein